MKFKDWVNILSDDIIKNSAFKCIGYCEKFFFYIDEGYSIQKFKEDIKKGWGPAEFEIVYISDIHYEEDKLWFTLFCNDGKDGLTNDQIKAIEKKSVENMLEKIKEYEKKHLILDFL